MVKDCLSSPDMLASPTMTNIAKWDATSPSQVKTYTSCARKWWFEKIEPQDVPQQQTGAQSLGSRIHAEIEAWLEKGTPPQDPLLRPTWDSWLHQFPAPQPYVEWHFSVPVGATGVTCRGYIDFIDVDPDTGLVTVWDHKTTRSTRYMKDSTSLRDDPQCVVYLYAVRHLGTSFRFGHHYIRTDKPSAPTFVTVDKTLEEIEADWAAFIGMTEAMSMLVAAGERPEGNKDACWEYGGCPFRSVCANYDDATFAFMYPAAKEETNKMSIFDSLASDSPVLLPPAVHRVYVDCAPMADAPLSFTEWVAPLIARYASMKGGVHPLVEPYQVGVRAVALEAANEWQRTPAPLLVSSVDPIGSLFATLIPAANVVRRLG